MATTVSSRTEIGGGLPPLTTRFRLGPEILPEQVAFLDTHGFLVFETVASADEIAEIDAALHRIERLWLDEKRRFVNGIPIFWGRIDGKPAVQRFAFSSLFSQTISEFVRDPRFEPIRRLVGENARVGDEEKDGVVVNRFLNARGSVAPALGWHTDGLRDLFYGRLPLRMLNVGLHLDDCPAENGGLRLIPGSHLQGFASMCFRKPYFVSHRPDPEEFAVETRPGDLTVHDGRLWHRVARSLRTGAASLRRSMYVPYLTGPYEPKHEHSRTPAYHHLGQLQRWLRTLAV
jgi:ectoine hydroxylase-related dioxygenase (phytanoyl-CoA dioxygenase family)